MARWMHTLVLPLLGTALLLSGCGTPAPSETPTPTGGTEVVTYDLAFNVWGYQDQFQGGEKPKYYDLVAEEINRRLEAERGYRLNFIPLSYPAESAVERINIELASQKKIEMVKMMTYVNVVQNFIQKDLAHDLSQGLSESGKTLWGKIPEKAWKEYTVDGKVYAMPNVDFPFNACAWIRGDWLKKASLDMPTTLEELEHVMQVFRDGDLDGNGKDDTVPMIANYDYLITFLYGLFSSHPGDYEENGQVYLRYEDPGFRQTLETMQRWYREGFINETAFESMVMQISANMFAKDKAGIEVSNIWNIEWGSLRAVYNSKKDIDLRFLPTLDGMKAYTTDTISSAYTVVPTTTTYPEIVVDYVDWMFESEENYLLTQGGMGIEGVTYVLDADGAPDLPQAEKDAGIRPGQLLSGPYTNMNYVQYGIKYLPAVTPKETRIAYKWSLSIPEEQYFQSIIRVNAMSLPDSLRIKEGDAYVIAREYIQKIVKGEATYEEFIDAWRKAGGDALKEEYTRQLND